MIIKSNPLKMLIHQIDSMFIDLEEVEDEVVLNEIYNAALFRMEGCFSKISNKYYHNDQDVIFNPLHVGQWTMFLYYIGNEASKRGLRTLSDEVYCLSKIISSADIYYEVEMPQIWFFDHPQGSVMGRGVYSDYFTFSQGCTVGNNNGKYPMFGKHVSMLSNSKVIGDCKIGNYVIFAANSYVIDCDIPSYSIVFGQSPNIVVKPITKEKYQEITGSIFIYSDKE